MPKIKERIAEKKIKKLLTEKIVGNNKKSQVDATYGRTQRIELMTSPCNPNLWGKEMPFSPKTVDFTYNVLS